jgi:transposase
MGNFICNFGLFYFTTHKYGVSPSTIRQWVVRYNNTESFNAKDNLTEQEKELIELRKRNKQLEMENDIFPKGWFH